MKYSCWNEYAWEEALDVVEAYLPDKLTSRHIAALGLPPDVDYSKLQAFFNEGVEAFHAIHDRVVKAIEYEREGLHIVQDESMDFLHVYQGNAQLSDKAVKRKEFYKKIVNRKANELKQAANKASKSSNAQNAEQRKQNRGRNNNQGQSGWNNNNNSGQNKNNNNGGGNSFKPGQGQKKNPDKCPSCLNKWHGNYDCPSN